MAGSEDKPGSRGGSLGASPAEPTQPGAAEERDTHELIEDALRNLWAVANDLSRIKPPASEAYRVTIFGSARIAPGEPWYQQAKWLARELAVRGCDIVSGGGPGLMQAANEGCNEGDPGDHVRSIGIRVALPFEQNANPFIEQLYTHRTFFTRLHQFVRLSSAFVVMGGGVGTLLEMAMVWQLLQVRQLTGVPLILVGEMWRTLRDWARDQMIERASHPFASPADIEIPICVDSVEAALARLEPEIMRFRQERARLSGEKEPRP